MHKLWCASVLFALGLAVGVVHAMPVRVCTFELPPHTMTDKDGKPDGHATRILQAVAPPLGWDLEFHYMPWARLVVEAKAGQCDVLYTVLKRADYEEFLLYPKQGVQDRANVLVVRRGSGIRYDGDLEGFMRAHSVGLYRDKAVDNRFETLRRAPWARVDEADSPVLNMRKLLTGRFDAAIENSLTAAYELQALNGLDAVEMLQPPLNVTPAYIVFPKAGRLNGDTSAFDKVLLDYKNSAEFKALDQRYLGPR